MELATLEKALLALEPISRIVPTTITRITANITAYSAMSWPWSAAHSLRRTSTINHPQKSPISLMVHHHDPRGRDCQCRDQSGFWKGPGSRLSCSADALPDVRVL